MTTTTPFSSGTFAPNPRRASVPAMIWAQAKIEAKLFLRHGEQQLLSMIIPAVMLIGLCLTPVLDEANPVDSVFPFALAVAGMSAGFTGQAIAVAFDRRYGALKRIGASGVPAWTIIFGKVLAVLGVAMLQALILGGIALALGWQPTAVGVACAVVSIIAGVISFTAMGLLLGGTLSSELVLALANLLWFLLLGVAAYVEFRHVGEPNWALHLVPSVAFSQALTSALNGAVPLADLGILAGWAALSSLAAVKLFRFTA